MMSMCIFIMMMTMLLMMMDDDDIMMSMSIKDDDDNYDMFMMKMGMSMIKNLFFKVCSPWI
jgi:hypothetical protein